MSGHVVWVAWVIDVDVFTVCREGQKQTVYREPGQLHAQKAVQSGCEPEQRLSAARQCLGAVSMPCPGLQLRVPTAKRTCTHLSSSHRSSPSKAKAKIACYHENVWVSASDPCRKDKLVPDVQHAQECTDDRPYLDGRDLAKFQPSLQSQKHVGSRPAIPQSACLQSKNYCPQALHAACLLVVFCL